MRLSINLSIYLFVLLMLLSAGCGVHNDLVKEYNDFGVKCAERELWDEAIMRWNRVIQMDPKNAHAYNNLAVAYESKGEFESALAGYKMAMEIDPDNKIYKSNYIKFKRNYERVTGKKNKSDTQIPGQKAQNARF